MPGEVTVLNGKPGDMAKGGLNRIKGVAGKKTKISQLELGKIHEQTKKIKLQFEPGKTHEQNKKKSNCNSN